LDSAIGHHLGELVPKIGDKLATVANEWKDSYLINHMIATFSLVVETEEALDRPGFGVVDDLADPLGTEIQLDLVHVLAGTQLALSLLVRNDLVLRILDPEAFGHAEASDQLLREPAAGLIAIDGDDVVLDLHDGVHQAAQERELVVVLRVDVPVVLRHVDQLAVLVASRRRTIRNGDAGVVAGQQHRLAIELTLRPDQRVCAGRQPIHRVRIEQNIGVVDGLGCVLLLHEAPLAVLRPAILAVDLGLALKIGDAQHRPVDVALNDYVVPTIARETATVESTRTIEIDEFVPKADIDPRYIIRPGVRERTRPPQCLVHSKFGRILATPVRAAPNLTQRVFGASASLPYTTRPRKRRVVKYKGCTRVVIAFCSNSLLPALDLRVVMSKFELRAFDFFTTFSEHALIQRVGTYFVFSIAERIDQHRFDIGYYAFTEWTDEANQAQVREDQFYIEPAQALVQPTILDESRVRHVKDFAADHATFRILGAPKGSKGRVVYLSIHRKTGGTIQLTFYMKADAPYNKLPDLEALGNVYFLGHEIHRIASYIPKKYRADTPVNTVH
jgi:hypothetical protein